MHVYRTEMSNVKPLNTEKGVNTDEVKNDFKGRFKDFSKLYLLASAVTLTIITLGALLYSTLMS